MDVIDELRAFVAREVRPEMDRATIVRTLGAGGWVAPHWEPRHGGRGLSVDDARAVLDELVQRNVVGERVLGLPREPDPYKGSPWRAIPRS